MADNARGIHVSPGIYSKETELTYAVKSLGITTLGLVGETLRGPAFQPMLIDNWRNFQSVFGGTSPEKFKGSQYPKYELPYIAKSYLTESNQLQVCRVLGLSGYNAGPAWAITVDLNTNSANGKKDKYTYTVETSNNKNYIKASDANNIKITMRPEYLYNVDGKSYDVNAQVSDERFKGVSGKVTVSIEEMKVLNAEGVNERSRISTVSETGADTKKTKTVKTTTLSEQSNVAGISFTLSGLKEAIKENLAKVKVIAEVTDKDGNNIDAEKTILSFNVCSDEYYNNLGKNDKESTYKVSTEPIVKYVNASGENVSSDKMVIAVLRSRGYYKEYYKYGEIASEDCSCPQQVFDTLFYEVGEQKVARDCEKSKKYNMNALQISQYTGFNSISENCGEINKLSSITESFDCTPLNLGRFNIVGFKGMIDPTVAQYIKVEKDGTIDINNIVKLVGGTEEQQKSLKNELENAYFEYPVSLNADDKEFILKVLGTDPINGDAPIYVESLYDVALRTVVESSSEDDKISISNELSQYQVYFNSDYCYLDEVSDIINKQEESLSRKDVGKRFLAGKNAVIDEIQCHEYNYKTKQPTGVVSVVKVGQIYTVRQYTDQNAKRHYYYSYYSEDSIKELSGNTYAEVRDRLNFIDESSDTTRGGNNSPARMSGLVRCIKDNKYYRMEDIANSDVKAVSCDLNNYKDAYRFASTPWIVSNIKGDYRHVELNKLFRFHTISDGSASNSEIKISIQNIRTDENLFDVVIRSAYDTDENPIILERYSRCSMMPNTSNYIAYRIGSYDGSYESKSKFVTVEVNESDVATHSVPAGFLGYPTHNFGGVPVIGNRKENINEPLISYNLNYNEDVKNRKQYFGLSNISGVDFDMFSYKGVTAYNSEPENLTQGFHLDSRLNLDSYSSANDYPSITVDGVNGYKFDAVSTNNRTYILDGTPIIGKEEEMYGSIYEYVDLRKFTVYFYGGFDGWDVYRAQRTNTDNFKITKYRGDYNKLNGEGLSFNKIKDYESLGLNQQAITSDYYAYLSAIRQFANPEEVDINVFATPGIDLVNNKTLAQEVVEMIENERADSIYVATLPDKPMGASDYINEMYTPEEVVYELDDTEIDSNYTCTYYPWIKYDDVENSQYIYLPPTKDVVRNMAMTDNTTHPWFAPAGVSRGDVHCVRAHYVTKLSDEDILYDGRINPIKTFASDGVKVWGQKNLQNHESQLNRIAVRRLLLRMRKLIAISCIGLIFEPNDMSTKNKFLTTVTPILDDIKSNRGISDYRIEVNDSAEARDRRELPAKIYFKPYNALEYIDLNFILTPEGVSFDNI